MKYIIGAVSIMMLAGCSSTGKVDPNYSLYVNSSKDIAVAIANKKQEPLFTMKGVPGQTIKLEGVSEITIFMPDVNNKNVASVAPYVAPKSEAVEMVRAIGSIVTPIGAILATGKATTDLANAVGNSANYGYQYVQAPQPNQTISGTGVIGDGSLTQNTVSGTGVVGDGTMTTETLSGTGTLGGGTYTTNDLTGTGTLSGDFVDSTGVEP